jgi:hypothetical protein
LKKYIPLLNFDEFWGEVGLLKNLSYVETFVLFLLFYYYYFLSLFIQSTQTYFLDIWIEVVAKGILGALLHNKRG